MPWKKTVKAGILLYALLMLALFSLLLQFYLNRQVALAQTNQANSHSLTAYAMAQYTKNKLAGELGNKEEGKHSEEPREDITENLAENEDLVKGRSIENAQADDAEQNRDPEPLDSTNQEEREQEVKKSVNQEETTEVPSKDRPSSGQITFDQGVAQYHVEKGQLAVAIQLVTGQEFMYQFPINSENH
ncbi:competence type IV pilus minor pilin ComGG [Streptococcus rifensis]